MIRADVIDSLTSLRRAMASTISLDESRLLRSRYLLRVVEVLSQAGLQQLLANDPDETEIVRWFRGELYRIAKDELEYGWSTLWHVLSPAQRFQAVSVSFDPLGNIKPPAISVGVSEISPMPRDVTSSSMALKDILWRISPLLVLNGDVTLEARIGSSRAMFKPGQTWVAFLVAAGRADTPVSWRRQISVALERGVANPLEFLLRVLRHEAMRIFNDVDVALRSAVPSYVGYTLRSQNLPSTDPEHAAKDGWNFYVDDREGGSLPWSERIIPPYRRNCACYMVPILEEPTDLDFSAQYRLPIGKGYPILIRDPLYFSQWFDRQTAATQKKLMGEKRWFAASSKGTGSVLFADFLQRDGKVMSPRRLLEESIRERNRRRIDAEVLMTAQSFVLREGWRKLSDHSPPVDPAIEAEYRDKLAKRLTSLLK